MRLLKVYEVTAIWIRMALQKIPAIMRGVRVVHFNDGNESFA